MKFLSHAYRFVSNFVFLAMVYYGLNFMEKYPERAVLALLVLGYFAMRAASALRSVYFFHRIAGLQLGRARFARLPWEGPPPAASRQTGVHGGTTLRPARA